MWPLSGVEMVGQTWGDVWVWPLSGVEMVGQTWGGCLGVATEWCGDGGADMGGMSGCGH